MKKFNLKNNKGYYSNYSSNILDIWYQENKITAYVEGTNIYKVQMIVKGSEISNYFCSCPYSKRGMSFCKHLSGIINYLDKHEIPEMENIQTSSDEIDFNLSINDIIRKFKENINNLIEPYYDSIDCYNSKFFLEMLIKYTKYINNLIEENKLDDAFKVIIQFLIIIDETNIEGYDEYYEGKNEILYYIVKLIKEYNYKTKIVEYIDANCNNEEVTNIIISLIDCLINNIETTDDAKTVINIISQIKLDDYEFDELIEKMIDITHDYVGLEDAIKLAEKYRNLYYIREKIIKYIEETHDKKRLIKEIKNQLKDSETMELYEKLLSIYLVDDIEEAKKLLLIMINNFHKINYYQKLKSISNKTQMKEYRNEIINNLNKNGFYCSFLLEIYDEDDLVDSLFKEIIKYGDLSLFSRYKEKINHKFHDKLANYYRKNIINKATKCYGRNEYYELCKYIKDLYQINCSSDFIMDMLKTMYSSYKTKKAFKEEILKVLNENDREKFEVILLDMDKNIKK